MAAMAKDQAQTDDDDAVPVAKSAGAGAADAPGVAAAPLPDVLILDDVEVPPDDPDVFVVSAEDLAPDANNEVVVAALEGMAITILSDDEIAHSGVASDHVTATGIDVAGLEYVSFSSGLTVYYQPDAVKVRR